MNLKAVKRLKVRGQAATAKCNKITYLRGMHQVANHTYCLVMDAGILGMQHVDQCWQRSAVHNLVLIALILESQSPQSTGSCLLDL